MPAISADHEEPTVVAGLDDIAVACEAIEQSGRHFGVAEDAQPLPDGEVRGDDRGALVEPADKVQHRATTKPTPISVSN
jgi:hypothetical protein